MNPDREVTDEFRVNSGRVPAELGDMFKDANLLLTRRARGRCRARRAAHRDAGPADRRTASREVAVQLCDDLHRLAGDREEHCTYEEAHLGRAPDTA